MSQPEFGSVLSSNLTNLIENSISGQAQMTELLGSLLKPGLDLQDAETQRAVLTALSNLTSANSELADALKCLALQIPRQHGPEEIVCVRHAHSERQLFFERERAASAADPNFALERLRFMAVPDVQFGLSKKGQMQPVQTAEWIAREVGTEFVGIFMSLHERAKETAGLLGKALDLPQDWLADHLLCERFWGNWQHLSKKQRSLEIEKIKSNPRSYRLPNGESILDAQMRAHFHLDDLYRRFPDGGKVLDVTHEEWIIGLRMIMERFDEAQLKALMVRGMPNCGVVRFSRRDPETQQLTPNFNWIALANPVGDPGFEDWDGAWRKIARPSFSSDALLAAAASLPKLYPDFS